MRKVISILLCFSIIMSLSSAFALSDISEENLALGKEATASSFLTGYGPENLTDGNINSGWSAGTGTNHSVVVDLGKAYRLKRVVLEMRKDFNQPETRCGFEVRVSNSQDMSNYVVIGSQGATPIEHGGHFIVDVVNKASYRYVQVIKTDGQYFFFNEILVYGNEITDSELKTVSEYSDITDKDLETKVQLLNLLGIVNGYDDNTFRPERKVTRAEACAMVANFLNIGINNDFEQIFEDVPMSYWGANSIWIMKTLGIVSGIGNGMFGPEENVTYIQFLKMVLNAMGCEEIANAKGGYPNGYLTVAASKGICVNDINNDDVLTREKAVEILYNSLDENIFMLKGIEDGKCVYEVNKKGTVLESIFDTEKYTGVVTATEYGCLEGSGRLPSGYIKVGDEEYKTGYDTFGLLGRKVTFYKMNTNESNDILLYLITDDRDYMEVDSDDIVLGNDNYIVSYYYSENESKKRTISISRDANIYINQDYTVDWDKEDLKPDNGYVRFVDSDSDGMYDVVSVFKGETFIINSISNDDTISIFGKYGNQITFNSSNDDSRYIFADKSGNSISLSAIEENDVATVYADKKKEFVRVIVNDEKITGKVSDKLDDSVIINGVKYDFSYTYKKAIADKVYGANEITASKNYTLYFDEYGKIVAAEEYAAEESDSVKYGYLAYASTKKELNDVLKLMIADTNGELNSYVCAERFNFNGVRCNPNNAYVSLQSTADNGKFGQVIRYSLNKKGEVNNLYSSLDASEETKVKAEKVYDNNGTPLVSRNTEYYFVKATDGFFKVSGEGAADFFAKASTKVLTVPNCESADADELLNKKNYNAFNIDSVADYLHMYVEAYNCDMEGYADFIINYEIPATADDGSAAYKETHGPVLVINKIIDSVDSDGMPIKKLSSYLDGKEQIYTFHEDINVNSIKFINANNPSLADIATYPTKKLECGDVIRCKVSGNMITSAFIMFSPEKPISGCLTKGWSWDNESVYPPVTRTMAGVIKDVYGETMIIAKGEPEDIGIDDMKTERYKYRDTKVYLYDRELKRIYQIKSSEIPLYTYSNDKDIRAFLRTNLGKAKLLLLVK